MSTFPEISSLFAALASNLQSQDLTARDELDLSVSNLSRSLNTSEAPRVRILDTALSLMCFTAPQVYDSVIEFTVKTIVAVLSSSIECKVLRINKEQVPRVGGSILKSDCAKLMEEYADVLGKLDGYKGDLCALLLYAVIRVAALAPRFPRVIQSTSNLEMKFSDSSTSALAKLIGYLPSEFTSKNGEIPIRLLLWHLDPMTLKQDISHMLQEITERPFLSLRTEIYNKIEWRSSIICLAISPSMFVETRAFLHNWFLMTGLASVLELQNEFVRQVLDIISRPMWWGISVEVGSKLPFSHAYFPYEHHLLRILAGPISLEYFQHLIHKISGSVSHAGVAAKFIAWILNPTCVYEQQLTVDYLVKVSELWTRKCSSSNKFNDMTTEETMMPKLHVKDGITSHELDSLAIALWLKEFKDVYIKLFGKKAEFSTSNTKLFSTHQNHLLRRIPLGILLLCPNHLNAEGCSLLLHHAATGNIQKVSNTQDSGQNQKRWKNDHYNDSVMSIEKYTKAEAIAGCKTVFDITDVAESISPSMFGTAEEELNFVCQLKLKTCNYLLKCIERLLQHGNDLQKQRDLLARVIRWRHQGKDVFGNKDLESVCDALNV
ncbi:hypothetical protein CDL12_10067 [Handroanthus impetiginosus]|uniref:Uncharacterized protein n=1 Tax=Handroanthus impetiginosus TaxID=429701 RepID=A0A2G9HID9_9LAMI|nr:hypothetical protein CDL12_10067 [Handroanthus impetiginosus]